jgi:hypothetical protein
MRYLIVSKVCNAAPERSQKMCSARVLQLRQLSMMSNPYGVSTTLMVKKLISLPRGVYPTEGSCRFPPIVLQQTAQSFLAMQVRKGGQVRWVAGDDPLRQIQFIDSLFDLEA